MQLSAIKYPSINAKIKGMYANRLKFEDYLDLYKQTNIKSVVSILKGKNESFKKLDDDADRQQIERILNLEIIYDLNKLVKYLDKQDTKIFNILISKFEISCIKRAVRLVASKKSEDEIIKIWTDNIFKNLRGLHKVNSLGELNEIVSKTKYADIFEKYKAEKLENSCDIDGIEMLDVFEIEKELDKFYFANLYNSVGTNSNLKKLIGTKIDFSNILWIYRMKFFYKFDEEKIKNILIKIRYNLSKKEIEGFISSVNNNEFDECLRKTKYHKIGFDDIYDFECKTRLYMYKLYKKSFKSNGLSINCIYSYLNMVEMENSDIISIVEAVRYGIDKEKLRKKLLF